MKTKLLSLGLGLVLNVSLLTAKADGLINFFTYNSDPAFGKVSYRCAPGAMVDGTFYGQLVGGISGGSLSPIGSPVPFKVDGGVSAVDGGAVMVTAVDAGTAYYYGLRVWNVVNPTSAYGQSETVQVTLGGTDSFGGFFVPPQANGFHNFTISPLDCPPRMVASLTSVGPAANLVLKWSKFPLPLTLVATTNLGPGAVWTTNLPSPVLVNNLYVVTIPATNTQQFFQLVYP